MSDPVRCIYEDLHRALPAAASASQKLRKALSYATVPVDGGRQSTATEIAELRGLSQRADALWDDLVRCINTRQLPRRKADQMRREHAQACAERASS